MWISTANRASLTPLMCPRSHLALCYAPLISELTSRIMVQHVGTANAIYKRQRHGWTIRIGFDQVKCLDLSHIPPFQPQNKLALNEAALTPHQKFSKFKCF